MRRWHENGQLSRSIEYVMGTRAAPETRWHSNGKKLSEGVFDERGRKTGEWQFWTITGAIDPSLSGTYLYGRLLKK